MGVQMVDATFTPTQMAACEFGFLHYEGFGLDLTWEDPVCPLSVIWEPAYSSVVAKPNMTVKHVDNSHARMFEFVCDKDEEVCRHSASHELPGFYPSILSCHAVINHNPCSGCVFAMCLFKKPPSAENIIAPNVSARQNIVHRVNAIRVPITREAVMSSLKNDGLMVFLQQLQGAKAGMDTAALKSQCRAYLVGFKQLPHPAHSWSAFLHDLFASCIDNEFAAEIVAMALLGQNVLDEEDLPMVLDVRPINIDNAATHRCRWQAMLFIHALSIVFPTAVVNGHSELVLPFLDDPSSQVRYTAFTALYPNQSASEFLAFSDFYGNLAHSEQKLLAEKIAENYPTHEAAQMLKALVNQHKVQILGAFCKIAQRDHSAIELLLYAEFDIFTSRAA